MYKSENRLTSLDVPFHCTEILTINNKTKLCISMTPGKKNNKWNRDIEDDIKHIYSEKIDVIVCLLEWSEMKTMNIIDYPKKVKNTGITFYHLPVKDLDCPHDNDLKLIVETILKYLLSGKNVLVHCKEGLGRSGVIVACCLCNFGFSGDESINMVRKQRKGAIQNTCQEKCVIKYGKSVIKIIS